MNSSKYFNHLVVFTAGIGMFLSTLDSGIINVALPILSKSFNVDASFIFWSITLYTLLLTSTIIIFGRMSDKYNHLNIYSIGLTMFLISSILCGFSSNVVELITFRGLQGIGAAMLQGTATAIITTTIPEHRQGPTLGTLSILLGIGTMLGPSIGGLLKSIGNWIWIFLINIPFIFIGLVLISKITGKLISRVSNTILMTIGLVIMIASYTSLGLLQYILNPVTISLLLLIYGIGGGFFLPSNTSAIIGTVSKDMQDTVGATQRMVQNIGIAVILFF